MTDIDKLKELAEAAKELSADHKHPGVWMHLFGDRFVYTRLEDGCRGRPVVGVDCFRVPGDQTTLDYVAAANPTAILSLIAEVERLKAALKAMYEKDVHSDLSDQDLQEEAAAGSDRAMATLKDRAALEGKP